MTVPAVVVEEHHEAFFVWELARRRGLIRESGNAVLHVDEHSDLAVPQFTRPPRPLPPDADGLRAFVCGQLNIANFIYAAVYVGLIDRVAWVQHGPASAAVTRHVWSDRGRGLSLLLSADVRKAGLLNPDRRHAEVRRTTVRQPAPAWEAELLDIDLDYFSCGRHRMPTRLEVVESEYRRLLDPYAIERLHLGSLLTPEEEGGRFYLRWAFPAPASEGSEPSDLATVRRRVAELGRWLTDGGVEPALITVCRSRVSGYTPAGQCEAIEGEVLTMLRGLYPVRVVPAEGWG